MRVKVSKILLSMEFAGGSARSRRVHMRACMRTCVHEHLPTLTKLVHRIHPHPSHDAAPATTSATPSVSPGQTLDAMGSAFAGSDQVLERRRSLPTPALLLLYTVAYWCVVATCMRAHDSSTNAHLIFQSQKKNIGDLVTPNDSQKLANR
jgi:hypothetical protein